MANMDYPTPCLSCLSDGSCDLTQDAVRDTPERERGKSRFWNSLSRDENRTMVDDDGEWSP